MSGICVGLVFMVLAWCNESLVFVWLVCGNVILGFGFGIYGFGNYQFLGLS